MVHLRLFTFTLLKLSYFHEDVTVHCDLATIHGSGNVIYCEKCFVL